MTQPDGANPSGAHNPTHPGSFLEWQNLTEAQIFDKSKAPIVGTTGSATQAQKDIAATDGNVIPSGSGLWQAFTRNADATFPRILLRRAFVDSMSCADSSHSHSAPVPDYQPDGHGANHTQLGFIECSKDRTYTRLTFGTGDSIVALGIVAMYAVVYLMDSATGNLTLEAQTADIKSVVTDTNREYTVTLPTPVSAGKGEIFAAGILQVTNVGQTCNSLLRLTFWPMTAPSGFKPQALYANTPGSTTPWSSVTYGSLTFAAGYVPYFALS